MRVTIIPSDHFVGVDGIGFDGIDMSSVPTEIHAVQWYDTWGEVEYENISAPTEEDPNRIIKPQNEIISDLSPYQSVIDLWQEKKDAVV